MRQAAIIGAGIGRTHAQGYADHPDKFRVKSVCDLDEARGRKVAEEFGAVWTSDMDAAVNDPEIDIVNVCLPPHLHLPASLKALEAGKHVVCEKPMVGSLAEADKLQAAAASSGKTVFPVFQYRYGLGAAQLHALREAGLLGKLYTATVETHWNRGKAYYEVPWRGKWATERGGCILGHAIHIHDLMTTFLGPVKSVYAELATRVNDIEVEDCAALAIRLADGAPVTSSVTLGCANDVTRLRFLFEGATVESDHAPYQPCAAGWSFMARDPYRQADIDAVLAKVPPQTFRFEAMFAAMHDALEGKPGCEVSLEDGRMSLEFVTAVYGSAQSGTRQDLPLPKDHPLYAKWDLG